MKENREPLVKLEDAGVKRDGRWLIRDLNISLYKGDIVTLIGPSGSGKSTTAKLVLGILKPDAGVIRKPNSIKVGYVPQQISIDWTLPLTVSGFMNLTEKLSRQKHDDVMKRVGVSHLKGEQMRTLSGGETRRVMLARAIARDPDLLVLDEPVQGVDFAGEIELYDLIRDIRNEMGCGVLMISHDLHLVMAATDHVFCLNGHICCEGSPKDVTSSDVYKSLFGKRAVPGMAVYEHQHDHRHLPDGRVLNADGSISDHCNPADGAHASKDERA